MARTTLMLEVRRLCRLNLALHFGLRTRSQHDPSSAWFRMCYKLLQTGYKTQDSTLLRTVHSCSPVSITYRMPGRINPSPDLLNGSNGTHDEGSDHDHDQDSDDEAPDATSTLVELSPDEFPSYFSERNGRLFHSGTSPYPLPVDTPEQRVRWTV